MTDHKVTALSTQPRTSLNQRKGARVPSPLRRNLPVMLLVAALSVALPSVSTSALAQGRVTLLQPVPSSASDWPSATRAALAELALAGFEVNVKRTRRHELAALISELERETLEERIVAALVITRTRDWGTARVWVRGSKTSIEIREAEPDAPIAQSSLALKLADLLRERRLPLPPSISVDEESHAPQAVEQPEVLSRYGIWPQLGFGASHTSGALAAVGNLGVRVRLPLALTLGIDARRTLSRLDIQTRAGVSSLAYNGLTSTLVINHARGSGLRASGGMGLGLVWLQSRAVPGPDYVGKRDTATTSIVSAVLQLGYSWDSWCLELGFEPGFLAPRVRVLASGSEVISLGRPWLNSFVMLRWEA